MTPPTPHGLGCFLAAQDMARSPAATAQLARRMGAKWAAVLIESVEGTRQHVDRVVAVCAELARRGIEPWLFTFPAPSHAHGAALHLIACIEATKITRVVVDLEPYKAERWSQQGVSDLFAAITPHLPAPPSITCTKFARRWPISWELPILIGSPIWLQLYETVRDPDDLEHALAQWRAHPVVVPLIATYLGDVHRLHADLLTISPAAMAAGALGIWALAATDANEAAELAAWSAAHETATG